MFLSLRPFFFSVWIGIFSFSCFLSYGQTQTGPSVKKKPAIAVIDFNSPGMEAQMIVALSDRLRTELFNTGQYDVMERGQMDQIIKEQGFQQSGVCTDEACLVEMGQLLGVEKLLAGSIGKIGTLYTINSRMIDMRTGKIEQSVAEDCACPVEGLVTSVARVAKKMSGQAVESIPTTMTEKPAPDFAPAPAAAVPLLIAQPNASLPVRAQAPLAKRKSGLRIGYFSSKMKNSQFNGILETIANDLWENFNGVDLDLSIGVGKHFYLKVGSGAGFSQYTLQDSLGFPLLDYNLKAFPLEFGIGYSLGKKLKFFGEGSYSIYPSFLDIEDPLYSDLWSLKGGGKGFQFDMGFELVPAPSISFGVDFFFRAGALNNFKGFGPAIDDSFYVDHINEADVELVYIEDNSYYGKIIHPMNSSQVPIARTRANSNGGFLKAGEIGIGGGGLEFFIKLRF